MSAVASFSPTIQFAQKLAGNDKHIRDRAVKKLKKWITLRSSSSSKHKFTEDDVLRLWKGLFYCMWMSDKPLIQEELADTLAKMIHCFIDQEATLLFIKCFFTTMNREWECIDYFRMDKFMMLVRRFLNESFEFLHNCLWDKEIVKLFLTILESSAINPTDNNTSIGLQMHIADIYVEELVKVAADELSGKDITIFLKPYCGLLATSNNVALRKTVISRIFHFTMRLHESGDNEQEDEEGDDEQDGVNPSDDEQDVINPSGDDDDDDNDNIMDDEDSDASENVEEYFDEEDELNKAYGAYKGEDQWLHRVRKHEVANMKLPVPEFDYKDIGETLLAACGTSVCKQRIRSENYALVKRFYDMANGIYPLDAVYMSLGKRLRAKDIEAAAKRLLEEEAEEEEAEMMQDSRLKKKRKKSLDETSDEEKQSGTKMKSNESKTIPSKPKKLKVKANKENRVNEDVSPRVIDKLAERIIQNAARSAIKRKQRKQKRASPLATDTLASLNPSASPGQPQNTVGAENLVSETKETEDGFSEMLKEATSTMNHANNQDGENAVENHVIPVDDGMQMSKSSPDSSPIKRKLKKRKQHSSPIKSISATSSPHISPVKSKNINKMKNVDTEMKEADERPSKKLKETTTIENQDGGNSVQADNIPANGEIQEAEISMVNTADLASSLKDKKATNDEVTVERQFSDKMLIFKDTNSDSTIELSDASVVEKRKSQPLLVRDVDLTGEELQKRNGNFERVSRDNESFLKEDITLSERRLDFSESLHSEEKSGSRLNLTFELEPFPSTDEEEPVQNSKPVVNQSPVKSLTEEKSSSPVRILNGTSTITKLSPTAGNELSLTPSTAMVPRKRVKLITLSSPSSFTSESVMKTPSLRRSTRTATHASQQKATTNSTLRTTDVMLQKRKNTKRTNQSSVSTVTNDEGRIAHKKPGIKSKKRSSGDKVDLEMANTSMNFAKFEEFVKTPPAFFRTAVKKISPKAFRTTELNDTNNESKGKSSKKVRFHLSGKNMQGTQEYVYSVKSSPGIPYDANKQPTQGVLKQKS